MPTWSYYLDPEGTLRHQLDAGQIREAFESNKGLLWVDFSEIDERDGHFLESTFHFHHLAIEDCVSPEIHRPKIDDFGEYLFIIVHGINHAKESELLETAELGIFLGEHFVVTVHNYPIYSIDSIRRLAERDSRFMQRGTDFLAHAILDALIDNILPVIDQMSERVEEIEEDSINQPHPTTLEAILKLKRSALRLHRVVAPQREIINQLSRGEFPIISSNAQIFYRDVYDHLLRIEDLNQSVRDRTADAMSTYLSSVANRQNETMKLLAIVAAIFLPLTLLAGIYGMNFEYMPELGWKWSYFIVLGVIVSVMFGLFWVFWARSWFSIRRQRVSMIKPFKVDPQRLMDYVDPFDHIEKLSRLYKTGRQNTEHDKGS